MPRPDLPSSTPVLIVGGGPVGLLTSILLKAQGIDNRVVERRIATQVAPAAHVINARTFEILRAAGVDRTRIESACQPPGNGWVRWVSSITGEELAHIPFERQNQIRELDSVTPTPLRNLSQHRLEPILADHVPELSRGIEWVSAREDADGVVSVLRDATTGETLEMGSLHLIGADGAGSPVRRWLGIAMQGPQRLQSLLNIHVEANLRSLVADRPATLYWIINPDIGGIYVAHDIDCTWVYAHPWNPDAERLEDYTIERCEALFRRGLGAEAGPITVRSIAPWTLSCQIADGYRSGRTFLVGDAAHRFPPTGGMGLNTGAVDAQNLAWKLAAFLHGWADVAILDSYEAERRPIAQANAQQSLENAMKLFEVAIALGADADPAVSHANFLKTMATPEGRARASAAAEEQAEHFDMLGLQLGFVYPASAGLVLDDGTEPVLPDDVVRDYLPNTRPGARLPHAWIEREGQRLSTLDLIPLDRFVLLTSSRDLAAAGEDLKTEGTAPLDVVLFGREVHDIDGNWARVSGLPASGALLVRPDQHVGWRTFQGGDEAIRSLRAALEKMTGGTAAAASPPASA